MGKSPGKWIKNVLFGKKSSKSGFSKDANGKTSIPSKAPSGDFASIPAGYSDPSPQNRFANRSGEKTEIENVATTSLPCDAHAFPENSAAVLGLNTATSAEIIKQEQAATKAQAAFRGYLARRAFRALKGIIRLQALIRGHLVRRQALVTLRCMGAIVKFQAVVRGRKVRLSNPGCEVLIRCSLEEPLNEKQLDLVRRSTCLRSQKLLTNPFFSKILASSPTAMPLSLQYDPVEPNSAWSWLDRWSSSRFWEPPARPKRILDGKAQRKQANVQNEAGKTKRTFRKVSTTNGDSSLSKSSDHEKPRFRKPLIQQPESVQEQPQNELERIKRNLRKISVSSPAVSDKSEAVTDKPQDSRRKIPSSSTGDVIAVHDTDTSERRSDAIITVPKEAVVESPPKPVVVEEPTEVPHEEHPAAELLALDISEKVENDPSEKEDIKEDNSKENPKTRKRRSLPTKPEYPENVSQNTSTLPSYMAATESAKAKLRAQGSPKPVEDGNENGFIRRHSLPSSTNGKLSAASPRVQKPVQANGRGGSKSKSLAPSRDEKLSQAGWRR